MLPPATSPDFPLALKNARTKLNLTRCAFADKAFISRKLLKRYEEPTDKKFTIPRKKTWEKINELLGYVINEAVVYSEPEIEKDPRINIFSNLTVTSVINIVEQNLIQNKQHNSCKTFWQPSSPYYSN